MDRRITLFAGHYGSGKTNIALNFARRLRRAHPRVAVADLDIVNPYFRTKDSAGLLAAEGIDLVVSNIAGKSVGNRFCLYSRENYVIRVGNNNRSSTSAARNVYNSAVILSILYKSFHRCGIRSGNGNYSAG